MKRPPLTLKGAERLRDELEKLKTVDRPRIIEAIAEARAHGDLMFESLPYSFRVSIRDQGLVAGARNQTFPKRAPTNP